MSSAMIYIIFMAIAFVAIVCLVTILIVTKKREREEFPAEEDEEEIYPVRKKEKKVQRQEEFEEYSDDLRKEERPDYGYSELNPIFTSSQAASERYLSALRTERGDGLRWVREGTVTVKKLNQSSNVNVECYTLYLYGREFKKIYICPFGRHNTNDTPKGLILASDGKKLSYNGSIALEAGEKGITEEQVLEKYALVYESKRAAASANAKNTSSGMAKKSDYFKDEPASVQAAPRADDKKESSYRQEAKSYTPPVQKTEEKPRASFPNYLPGFEPEEMKPALEKFLAVMDRAYPDGVVKGSTWDHDRWDRAASMLCKYLGYANGTDFLEAYGYTVEK